MRCGVRSARPNVKAQVRCAVLSCSVPWNVELGYLFAFNPTLAPFDRASLVVLQAPCVESQNPSDGTLLTKESEPRGLPFPLPA